MNAVKQFKTLKDLPTMATKGFETNFIDKGELKKEAIKYLKHLEEAKAITHETERFEISDGEMAFRVMTHTQAFIKHFFDISDEEIKWTPKNQQREDPQRVGELEDERRSI